MNTYVIEETLRLEREQAIRDAAKWRMLHDARPHPLRHRAAHALHRFAERLEGSARRPAISNC